MHEPAEVGGELLSLRPGKEKAVVQGVDEPPIADPSAAVDYLAVIVEGFLARLRRGGGFEMTETQRSAWFTILANVPGVLAQFETLPGHYIKPENPAQLRELPFTLITVFFDNAAWPQLTELFNALNVASSQSLVKVTELFRAAKSWGTSPSQLQSAWASFTSLCRLAEGEPGAAAQLRTSTIIQFLLSVVPAHGPVGAGIEASTKNFLVC